LFVLPKTFGQLGFIQNLYLPPCLNELPLTTDPNGIARAILEAGQQQQWFAAGGIDLWAEPKKVNFDEQLAYLVASRVEKRLVGSPMRALLANMNEAIAQGVKVCTGHVGNADHDLHPVLDFWFNGKKGHYAPFGGAPGYRQAVAYLHRAQGWAPAMLKSEHVFVTNGTADGIQRLFNVFTLRRPGATAPRIGVFTKKGIWPNVVDDIAQARAELVPLDIENSNLDATFRTLDMAYVINPAIFEERWTPEQIAKMVALCRGNNLILLVDGVYNAFEDPNHFISLLELYPEGVIEVGSLSKEFAAGKLHLGTIKLLNPKLIEILTPALQDILCMPDFADMQSVWAPLVLLTSAHYIPKVRPIYQARVAELRAFEEKLTAFGVRMLVSDCGPYLVLEMRFDTTKFSQFLTGTFRTMFDDGIWTAVGTAMQFFYPGSDTGHTRFRISAVQSGNGQTRFMEILERAIPAFMKENENLVDWNGLDKQAVIQAANDALTHSPSEEQLALIHPATVGTAA